jgi:hypothetical protein
MNRMLLKAADNKSRNKAQYITLNSTVQMAADT